MLSLPIKDLRGFSAEVFSNCLATCIRITSFVANHPDPGVRFG